MTQFIIACHLQNARAVVWRIYGAFKASIVSLGGSQLNVCLCYMFVLGQQIPEECAESFGNKFLLCRHTRKHTHMHTHAQQPLTSPQALHLQLIRFGTQEKAKSR